MSPGAQPHVHLHVYNVPVPDEPEYGIQITVDADYAGTPGRYAIGYGIDQESAIFISRDMNGQPKYPCAVTYYRLGDRVTARCSHQGYTFLEFSGQVSGVGAELPDYDEHEWWVKVSRAVGGAEKAYDFPPHVVKVATGYGTAHLEELGGELLLRESPWDPLAQQLPQRELVRARLDTPTFRSRQITLEGKLDPEAYWPFSDTIGGSRWPGQNGGPKRG
ncbi:MAG: acetoacetate decarboxylase family protein [Myxococcota bacterium]